MLKHTRVSKTLDTARLGEAIARPGIDTRTWVSLAIVKSVVIDPEEGVFADVLLMPTRDPATARLGTEYAGNGFGLYAPVEKDDEVLVECPSGDFDHGLVITRRLHSPSDPPPQDVVDHPSDVLLHVKSGQTLRLVVAGAGDVVVDARGDGKVKLGSEEATKGVARIEDRVATDMTVLQTILDARYQLRPSPPPLDLNVSAAAVAVSQGDPGIAQGEISTVATASDKVVSS